MKLYFYETALCRTPAFDMGAALEPSWEELKQKISGASADFFMQVTGLDPASLATAEPRLAFTVWKYFNRARYRATPFGSFAGVSLVDCKTDRSEPLVLNAKLSGSSFTDWSEKEFVDTALLENRTTILATNTTVYTLGEEVRYIRFQDGQFELAAVARFPELDALLSLCRFKRSLLSVEETMLAEFDLDPGDTRELIRQLLAGQLLLSDRQPNITGPDYFARVGYQGQGRKVYELAERSVHAGGLSQASLQVVKEWAQFAANYVAPSAHPGLESFRQEFLRRYEQREVPLLHVLDPETGIGYGKSAQAAADTWVDTLRPEPASRADGEAGETAICKFLLGALVAGQAVQLEKFEGQTTAMRRKLPNSMGLLLRFAEGKPVLAAAAGCTANALLGRFSLLGCPFARLPRRLAALEQEANPDVIFFDLAYQAEAGVDNVNRRRAIYSHELPLLTWSCENSIDLNDVVVSVRGHEIVLRSVKEKKRLIPRLASAYNYTRSDLAVYRFLCDLQHDNLCTNLGFNPADHLPGMDHYPRVFYKNLILAGASWKVPVQRFLTGQSEASLGEWLTARVSGLFKAGTGDQELVFDSRQQHEVSMFMHFMRQHKDVDLYIKEALMTDRELVTDELGRSYQAEFVVPLCHRERLYTDYPVFRPEAADRRQVRLPGGNWLFFSVFCHPIRSNELLLNALKGWLERHRSKLKRWFFIRYEDPQPHLRLRLQLRNPLHAATLMRSLHALLEPQVQTGRIGNLSVNTYHPETERYGTDRMSAVENFFYLDSEAVLQVLAKVFPDEVQHAAAAGRIALLFLPAIGDQEEQFRFVSRMAGVFAAEMQFDTASYRQMNARINLPWPNEDIIAADGFASSLKGLLASCNTPRERRQLLSDLIHMHVNRLFSTDQRLHEAIIYQYLLKHVQRKQRPLARQAKL